MDPQNDMEYLKRYVQHHPDNRMAWYLLGKQYMRSGKEAKANYCFLQAGSIYEAYEKKSNPLAGRPQQMIEAWNRSRKWKSLLWRSSAAAILLFAIVLAEPFAQRQADERQDVTGDRGFGLGQSTDIRVAFIKPVTDRTVASALGALMQDGRKQAGMMLAVELEQEGAWREWTGRTKMLLSATNLGNGEAYDIRLYDAGVCSCKPADDQAATAVYKEWNSAQEERWTLSSAIMQFRELYGRLPASLDEMVRPYPNNVIAGETKGMRAMFPTLLDRYRAEDGSHASARSRESSGIQTADVLPDAVEEDGTPLPDKPLSIIVDKQRHSLAVISGDIIVRSYAVGLGGDKTPEGSFYISEKVKNPNGRDDGEYGSRGMTLSGTRYAIHGTDEPGSIGRDESHGCVRMLREDLEELYDLIPLGTKVDIKSGVLPAAGAPAGQRFKLQPMQDEMNPAVIYRWLE